MPERGPEPPPAVWRRLGLAAILLLHLIVAGIVLISAGVFDPQPVGPAVPVAVPPDLAAPAGVARTVWLTGTAPLAADFTLQLTAGSETPADAGYGLAFAAPDAELIVGVSPLGYVGLWTAAEAILPWQTWPHVRADANEIWVDRRGATWRIWINRELLWEGNWSTAGLQPGLYVAGFGDPIHVNIHRLTRHE